jgi:putative component of membrane protein insertase Oxa1/YidC/SpoIIIJ protein YidD
MLINIISGVRNHIHLFDRRTIQWRCLPGMLGTGLILMWAISVSGCTPTRANQPKVSLYENMLGMYHEPLNHLSAVRRGVCPMHPSCSEYSRQAVEKHGFGLGWTMAMDRLLRCGRDELRHAPTILVDGQWKIYDPLSANDNWWYLAGEDTQPDLDKAKTPGSGP